MTPSDQGLPDRLAAALLDPSRRIAIESFPRSADAVDSPGLYAWFVDAAGAAQLEESLSSSVVSGLIYAGQAGAGTSSATLRGRVGRSHARGSIRRSTFRWTLAAVLGPTLDWIDRSHKLRADGEQRLSRWIADHLKVAVAPIADCLTLLKLEDDVLAILDPPLNLQGMPATPLRATLSSLRASLPHDGIDARRERRVRSPRVVASERRSLPASGLVGPAGGAPDIHRFLAALEGKTIATMTGRPNRILKVSGDVVWVATGRSPAGKLVPISDVQVAANDLYRNSEVSVSVETVGHRSAFVGAVLSALPGTRADTNPRRIVLERGGSRVNQASASSERRIALVGCVKQKQRGTHTARTLYRSPLFTKRRAHVERRGLPWFVLSAKYGLVEPDDAIASYDVTLNRMGVQERDAWGEGVVHALEQKLGDVRGLVFEVHAGERYVTPIEARLAARGASIDAPTRGLPMGKQLQWYGRQLSEKASRSVFTRR